MGNIKTEFHIFTTTGYLSLASKQVDVFTSIGTLSSNTVARALNAADWTVAVFDLKSFYSNVVYTLRRTTLDTINNLTVKLSPLTPVQIMSTSVLRRVIL